MRTESNIDIKHGGLDNRPGLSWVRATPINAIDTSDNFNPSMFDAYKGGPPGNDGLYSHLNIPLRAGFNWLDIASDFPAPFSFTETQKAESPHGPIFLYSIRQELPQDDPVLRGNALRFYTRNEWVVVCRTTNGAVRVLGLINNKGAKFKKGFASGSHSVGSSINTLEFTQECSEQAFYVADPAADLYLIINSVVATVSGSDRNIASVITLSNTSLTPDITLQYFNGTAWVDVQTFTPTLGSNSVSALIAPPPPGTYYWFRANAIGVSGIPIYSNQVQVTIT